MVIATWNCDGLLQAFSGADVFGIGPPEDFITGPFRPNAIFGIILSVLLPLTFWEPLKHRRPEAFALLSATLLIITLTGQRNNLLLTLIGLFCLSLLWKAKTLLLVMAILTSLSLLIACIPLSPALQERAAMMMQSIEQAPLEFKASQTHWTSRHENNDFLSRLNIFSSDRGYLIEAGLRMSQKTR